MKLSFIINAIANYGRLLSVMRECVRSGHDVSVICGGSAVLDRFAQHDKTVADLIEHDFQDSIQIERVFTLVEQVEAESVGMAALAFANVFRKLNPDYVVCIGDRYETLGAVTAAYYQNRCIVHFQGGEISGTLDEGARHAITQLSHFHVPATEEAAKKILRMGQSPESILCVGCPGMDLLQEKANPEVKSDLLAVFHPNTCDETERIEPLLEAIDELHLTTLMVWPNADAGSQRVMKAIRKWREHRQGTGLTMRRYLHPIEWAQAIKQAKCCVGNSSSFVREAVAAGVPVVLLGERQHGRVKASNVLKVTMDAQAIANAVRSMVGLHFKGSDVYGSGYVAREFVKALDTIEPYTQKVWYEEVSANTGNSRAADNKGVSANARSAEAIQR